LFTSEGVATECVTLDFNGYPHDTSSKDYGDQQHYANATGKAKDSTDRTSDFDLLL
jgi:hypothetical protein